MKSLYLIVFYDIHTLFFVFRNRLFNAIFEFEFIKKKADWAMRWISSQEATFGERLIAFGLLNCYIKFGINHRFSFQPQLRVFSFLEALRQSSG